MIGTKTVGPTVGTSRIVVDEEFEKVVIQTAVSLFVSKMSPNVDQSIKLAFKLIDEVRQQGEERANRASENERRRREGR
jgi:hypothetical protein